ncbi:hypothetical protein AALP_AA6G159900 [Arabis alpina]|uniref:Uncharacterized protein n=1 Tax=Arabis alpina TaxID=50452 RepID=A0A087GPJ3_ARAAL|nr:hypothetical protein AALP_AA6G159900 [Arabis alpina]
MPCIMIPMFVLPPSSFASTNQSTRLRCIAYCWWKPPLMCFNLLGPSNPLIAVIISLSRPPESLVESSWAGEITSSSGESLGVDMLVSTTSTLRDRLDPSSSPRFTIDPLCR